MRLWFAMIKVSRKTYNTISRIYRFGGFAIILGLLLGFSWLVGKPIEFLCVFLPYFATKGLYARQFHARSLKECFTLSLIVFGFVTISCIPHETSLMYSVLIGLAIAFISCKIGDVQLKLKDYEYIEPRYNWLLRFYTEATDERPFDVDDCTEEELKDRCKALHLSEENTELAIEFFVRKTKHKIIAERLCIDEKSVTTRKKRLKAKLNSKK